MTRRIDYGQLMHAAMRGLIRTVLEDVAAHGLPGEHHFFITFSTLHPDVEIADWLSDRYPEEMTIVLQHWYDGLEVGDDGFAVTLNFNNAPEPLFVPWDSLRTFVDPSVEFGLRFDTPAEAEIAPMRDTPEPVEETSAKPAEPEVEPRPHDAEIVSLDSFRK